MTKQFLTLIVAFGFLSITAQEADVNKSVQELIKKGIEQHDAREYKKAIEAYNEALVLDSSSMNATYELALSYLALKDYENAYKFSTIVIDSKDKNLLVGAYGVKSESLAETERVDEAIVLLENALRELGNNYYLHFNLALNYFKKKDLDKTIYHVENALNLDKFQSGAFLLSAHALSDKQRWVQSIISFHFFLLNEPNSHRSKIAFKEMLQIMHVKETIEQSEEEEEEVSFIQKQLERNSNRNKIPEKTKKTPPLNTLNGINRELVYNTIEQTLDSLEKTVNTDPLTADSTNMFLYNSFKEVTRTIFKTLSKENDGTQTGVFWRYQVPVISKIVESPYFDTYCRYISVAYFPESLKWWEDNQESAVKFARWVEKGDEDE